jgi:protein SCO1/2
MIALLCLLLLVASPTHAAVERPAFAPRIGAQLDLSARLTDADGRNLTLAEALEGRPALVVFGYDRCPNLCGVTQQAVAAGLRASGLDADAYRALFVSIDETETPADARAKKEELLRFTDASGLSAWRFLTGADGGGATLAAQAGIAFDRRDRIRQYVHPIAVLALTPQGRIAQVLPALSFEPRDLRLALVEASAGRLGSIADHVFLLCAGFDPTKGQYTPAVWAGLRVGGLATVLLLGGAIALLAWRRRA